MTFEEVCVECIKNTEFVNQFNRLSGCQLGIDKRTPLDRMIDKSCGYDGFAESQKPYFNQFCDFVMDVIYIPMILKAIAEVPNEQKV